MRPSRASHRNVHASTAEVLPEGVMRSAAFGPQATRPIRDPGAPWWRVSLVVGGVGCRTSHVQVAERAFKLTGGSRWPLGRGVVPGVHQV